MSDDVLTQARTPTEAEVATLLDEPLLDNGWDARETLSAVYAVAAPRILALAYREAAREMCDAWEYQTRAGNKIAADTYWNAKEYFGALATALEEGTP